MSDLQRLFAAVQRACPPRAWSRGVELARAEAVAGEAAADPAAIALRIAVKGAAVAPLVTLWPADGEWECECDAGDDACFHVAAAVIALRRAREAGLELPVPGPRAAWVGYRLTRADGGLAFDRVLVHGDGRELPLAHPLTHYAAGRVEGGPALFTRPADMTIEVTLGALARGVLPAKAFKAILPHLAACRDLTLDGAALRASVEPVVPHLKLADDPDGDGFRLSLVRAPDVEEVFANGLARCGDALRPVGATGLDKDYVAKLKQGVRYPLGEAARLLDDVLPALEAKVVVHRVAKRLPRQVDGLPPCLAFDTARRGDVLEVRPLILYGDPPIARVDGDRLTLLGDGKARRQLPRRDLPAEQRLRQRLRERGLAPGETRAFTPTDALDALPRLAALGPLRGDAHRAFVPAPPLHAALTLHGGAPAATFTTTAPDGATVALDARRVLAAWEAGDTHVPLLEGGFAPLPVDWLSRYGDHLRFLLAARDADGKAAAWALPALAQLCADLDQPPPPELAGVRALVDGGFDRLPAPVLPSDLRASLRDYQRQGVAWLQTCRRAGLGALLADDMGLGKTLQALTTFVAGERALVVAPTSVLHGWLAELARFRPGLRVRRYHGPRRALDQDADVTVTTYAILRLDAHILRRAPGDVPWDILVLDEAQAIKNPESQVADAAFQVEARARVALTGTPVENRLDELWSLLHLLNPGLLGGRADFQERFARPIAEGAPGAAARLRARIRPFILRRKKSEVARELPPRTEVVLRCQLSPPERDLYDALRLATRREVVAELEAGKGVLQALEALLRLRQAASHRALVPGQEASSSAKVDLLVETLDEAIAEGHKALVFSQWTGLLDLVEPALRRAGLAFTRLDGATRDRAAVVAAFQDPQGPPVMLISLKAGGTGLTLTAADHVFLLDPWWNPAVEDQAADRAHRIGQDRPVLVHRLVAEDTVEERILALQEQKRAVADAALGDADAAAGLTRQDLLALLE